jgi:hypothetical protein
MDISDGLYERMVASADETEKVLEEAIEQVKGCEANCPVCAIAVGGLEGMLAAVKTRRQETVKTLLSDPETGHSLVIASFAMAESFKAHVSHMLKMIAAAHEGFDDITEDRVNFLVAANGNTLREAAQDILRRCDEAEATVKPPTGKHGAN